MQHFQVHSTDDLRHLIAEYGKNALFRGQTTHYGQPGHPSVVASSDRQICHHDTMLKWCTYSRNVLETFLGRHKNEPHFVQALLQHYGWRSFYVDCSANPAVSTWFASHIYREDKHIEMSEDCNEEPVLLLKRLASYDFEDGDGHLYIIDKEEALKIGLADLSSVTLPGCRPRTVAQEAWLLGPLLGNPVPQQCFRAQITAPRSVLRDYAFSSGFTCIDDVFPSIVEDPILNALLSLPWREIKEVWDPNFPIPCFRRTLSLPEYQDSFVKIAWPRTAFFRGTRLSERFSSVDGNASGGIIIPVPDVVFFGTAPETIPLRFPELEALLLKFGSVIFELDELIQHTSMQNLTSYQKGVGVVMIESDLIQVSELMVEHPGQEMTATGLVYGWYYRKSESGLWSRVAHPDECPCDDAFTHNRHLSALKIVEDFLRSSSFVREKNYQARMGVGK
ncbi:FRG domain-containing protein [Serratia bockelmannii]|uniref:FRG domain-containing protein n=1 Tax=Serratia bockelmannii TaxID=2703793 RepID=UPI00313CBD69